MDEALDTVIKTVQRVSLVSLIFLPFQALFPAVRRKPKVLTAEFWLDVLYTWQGVLAGALSVFTLTGMASVLLFGDELWFPQLGESLPYALQIVISLWAFDFIVYWRHRFEHRLPFLWWFHATHHTAEQIDPLTTSRLHLGELMMGAILNSIVGHIGFADGVTHTAFIIYLSYNYFIHANLKLRFPGFLRYVFVSPFMHQWHHALEEEAHGKNVGVIFAWNDWLFGTAYHPEHQPRGYGVAMAPGEEIGRSWFAHAAYPFKMMWRTVTLRAR